MSEMTATAIAEYHSGAADWLPDGCDQAGAGSQRIVYVDYATDTAYKIGDDGANRQEVRTLTELRKQGVDYAPAAKLHEVTVTDPFGEPMTCTVVEMPYLPDDGSVARPYPVLPGAADLNPAGNVHAHGGQLWLIDAGGL